MSKKAYILVGANLLCVRPILPVDAIEEIKENLSFRVHNFQFTKAYKRGWDGYKCLWKKGQVASSGLYQRLNRILIRFGYDTEVKFKDDVVPSGKIEVHGLTLAKFQKEMTKKAGVGRFGIMHAQVRSGKTAIISATINYLNVFPVVVVTKGKDIVKQTRYEIMNYTGKDVGVLSEGVFEPGLVTVASYQALQSALAVKPPNKRSKNEKLLERNKEISKLVKSARVLLLDECQYAFSGKIRPILRKFTSASFRIGLSGTPRPSGVAMMEMESVIGPILGRIGFKKLIQMKRVAQPRVVFYRLPSAWYDKHVFEFSDEYQRNIVENSYRNRFISELVDKLFSMRKSVFVMVAHVDHGNILRRMIRGSYFVNGSVNTDTRFKLYKALQKRKLRCIISTVGKIGLNLPLLHATINAEGYCDESITTQKMRSLTYNDQKKFGLVIDFGDHGPHLIKHSERRLSLYRRLSGVDVRTKTVTKEHFYAG